MKKPKGMYMKYKINSWEKLLTKKIVCTRAFAEISVRYGMLCFVGLSTTFSVAAPKVLPSTPAATSITTPSDAAEAPQYIEPTADFPTGLDTSTKIVPPSPLHKHGTHAQHDKDFKLNRHNHLPVKSRAGRRLVWTKGYPLVSLKKNK